MRISTERFGIKVSCQYDADISDLKKILSDASERYTDVYVPRDVSKEGNGYSFFVNHRQSLKDYVSVNGFSIDEFVGLLRRLYHFYEKCGEDFHNIVFDYECIFWGISVDDVEFVYAPEQDRSKEIFLRDNRCSDMLCIVSLMIVFDDNTYKEVVKDVLQMVSDWEDRSYCASIDEAEEEFSRIVDYADSKLKTVGKGFQNTGAVLSDKIKGLIQKALVFLSEDKKPDSRKVQTNRKITINGRDFFSNIEYKGKTDVLYIGRDPTWADIILNAIFVSRKHAMLFCENGKWFIKDLNSLNGTFVDNKKIDEGDVIRLHHNAMVHFGKKEGSLRIGLR
ncbi:MAG: FHA domain-containing protein [Clostridia bacterium]|nr:FHA domain-containing protein [Clostridia bacterium]